MKELNKKYRLSLGAGWLVIIILILSLDLIFDTAGCWFPDNAWYSLHAMGGSIFLIESVILSLIIFSGLLFFKMRAITIFFCILVFLHWSAASYVSSIHYRILGTGSDPLIFTSIIMLYAAINILVLLKYQLKI